MDYSKSNNTSTNCRPWSVLPHDILQLISEKTIDVADFVRLRASCSSWRSALVTTKMPKQLPWLMLNNSDPISETRQFLCPATGKEYTFFLPEAVACLISGCSHGWLILFCVPTYAVSLLNPFTRVRIHLPPLTRFPSPFPFLYRGGKEEEEDENLYIYRAFLSSNPTTSSDCVVMAMERQTSTFAYCRVGDKSWTFVWSSLSCNIESISYKAGLFYAMDFRGAWEIRCAYHPFTVICQSQWPWLSNLVPLVPCHLREAWSTLITSKSTGMGIVMIVHTERLRRRGGFQSFDAFLLNLSDTPGLPRGWCKIGNFSQYALFWAGGQYFPIDARRFEGIIERNCIYYPVYESGRYCVRQFKFNEKNPCRAEPPPSTGTEYFNQKPVWITPTLS